MITEQGVRGDREDEPEETAAVLPLPLPGPMSNHQPLHLPVGLSLTSCGAELNHLGINAPALEEPSTNDQVAGI